MNTQDQQSLTKLIELLNSGANFYRQAELRLDSKPISSKFKYFVKAREISMHELEPYIAAITSERGASTWSAEGVSATDCDRVDSCNTLVYSQIEDCHGSDDLTYDEFEKMEGKTLDALDQAIQIPASQSLRTLLSEIRGRTSACCYNLRQMRQAEV